MLTESSKKINRREYCRDSDKLSQQVLVEQWLRLCMYLYCSWVAEGSGHKIRGESALETTSTWTMLYPLRRFKLVLLYWHRSCDEYLKLVAILRVFIGKWDSGSNNKSSLFTYWGTELYTCIIAINILRNT